MAHRVNAPSSPLLAALALPAVALVATLPGCGAEVPKDGGLYAMEIAGKPFTLKVACSDATRQRGLGGVTAIADDGGMLFIFPGSAMRRFWMKDCVVDMDIVFLDPLGFVTAVHTMTAEPLRRADESEAAYEARLRGYSSVAPAQFAIELRKGRAAELGLKPAQRIPLDTRTLRAVAQ
jgi:uncharacterized membrane protein (UPF0127 family)